MDNSKLVCATSSVTSVPEKAIYLLENEEQSLIKSFAQF